MGALERLRGKQYEPARMLVAKARLWPERLGAGKPYDTDTRLEDYAEAAIARAEGKREEARRLLVRVSGMSVRRGDASGPQDLLGALAPRNRQKRPLCPVRSLSCARIPPIKPGHSATVFVTFAVMGGIPSASNVGKVIKVPPPASAFPP